MHLQKCLTFGVLFYILWIRGESEPAVRRVRMVHEVNVSELLRVNFAKAKFLGAQFIQLQDKNNRSAFALLLFLWWSR